MSRGRQWLTRGQRERVVETGPPAPRVRGRQGPPSVIYTVMADYGGAWAWMKDFGHQEPGVGSNVGYGTGWAGRHPLPRELLLNFCHWQDWFDRHVPIGMDRSDYPLWPWRQFHQEGRALCQRLKQLVGHGAVVRYARPCEDPYWSDEPDVEFDVDGSFVHVPRSRGYLRLVLTPFPSPTPQKELT